MKFNQAFDHFQENDKSDCIVLNDEGGFVLPQVIQSFDFGKQLGCENTSFDGIAIDFLGRTNIAGVYAARDASVIIPAQLIIAASEGS